MFPYFHTCLVHDSRPSAVSGRIGRTEVPAGSRSSLERYSSPIRHAQQLWVASGTETSASACSAASASSTGTAWARKRLCLTSTACVAAVASVCRLTGVWSLRQQRAQVLGQLGLRIAALVFAQAFARGIGLAFGEQLDRLNSSH